MRYDNEIEMWPIERIIPYDKNPKRHPEVQIEKLAKHIAEIGWDQPIVVDEDNLILKGHGRRLAALKLGLKEVPVVQKSGLSGVQKKKVRIADNKLNEAPWVPELLKLELEEIQIDQPNLEPLGFELHELEDLLDEPTKPIEDNPEKDDSVPEEKEEAPFVQPGDVWRLGNHILVCGDSTNQNDVLKLGMEKVDLIFTDPPYGVEYDADWRKDHSTAETKNMGSLQNDDKADWTATFSLIEAPVAYVWHDAKQPDITKRMLTDNGFEIRNQIIWNKSIHAISRGDYHWKHEPCWYAVRKGFKSKWSGKRDQNTVWDCPPPHGYNSKEDHTGHPSQKPVALIEKALMNHDCETVYDPFLGSGSTLIACEKVGKRCFGLEIDPKFASLIVKRYASYTTGTQAVLKVLPDQTRLTLEKVLEEMNQ